MKWLLAAALCVQSAGASEIADAVMHGDAAAIERLLAAKADVNEAQPDGSTALHWAARRNDAETARLLIQAGANANAVNHDGATPMFLAAQNGDAKTVAELIRAGADVNAPVLAHGETALMMAARSGNVDAVKLLLDRGARLETKDTLRGTTALMWAAEQGHAAVIELLAERGANPRAQSDTLRPLKRRGLGFAPASQQGGANAPVKGGLTALLFAAREGFADCVRALVKAGADVNQTAADGSSPLLVAVQNGYYDLALELMNDGANVNRANNKGWTPLYLAVKNRNQETTAIPGPNADGALDFIRTLLERGANPNVRIRADTEIHQGMTAAWLKEAGATPLLRAALCGDLEAVRLLLAHKADASIPTFDRTTALMAASGVGWADGMLREYSEDQTAEVVKLLIDLGGDVNAANDHGITALHGAGFKGANKVVQLLVDHGARLDALDKGEDYGFGVSTVRMTPLNWAEGVPIGMSSPIYHAETVALMAKLMQERGIPVVYNSFKGQKPANFSFPDPAAAKSDATR